jgi:hypothetical protein
MKAARPFGTLEVIDVPPDTRADDMHTIEYVRTMAGFVVWEPTAKRNVGRIVAFGWNTSGDVEEMRAANPNVVMLDELPEGLDFPTHYVLTDSKQVLPRLPSPVTLDGVTLKGMTGGSQVVIDNVVYDHASGTQLKLKFDQPGTYRVIVRSPVHLDKEFTVKWP